jgi:hypothetical protein
VTEIHVVNVTHELDDDDGKVVREPTKQVVMTRRCGDTGSPHPVLPFVPPPKYTPAPQSGGDL